MTQDRNIQNEAYDIARAIHEYRTISFGNDLAGVLLHKNFRNKHRLYSNNREPDKEQS